MRAFASLLLLACACRSHAPEEQPAVTREERVATIEGEPRLVIRKSMPPGYVVSFDVQLKTSCERVEEPRIRVDGTTIEVEPLVSAPSGEACEAVSSTARAGADLGSDFPRDTTFVVRVGGKTVSFTTP